jgi:hypothetical protein
MLEIALGALNRVAFSDYWERSAKRKIETRIRDLSQELPKYDIVPAIVLLLRQFLFFAHSHETDISSPSE